MGDVKADKPAPKKEEKQNGGTGGNTGKENAEKPAPQKEEKQNGGTEKKTEEEDNLPDAVPLGNPIKEEDGRKYYKGFEYEGTEFKPLDTVTLNPDEGTPDVPYFALIKDIWKEEDEELHMTIQWFYRPDEAVKRKGDLYPTRSKNELFYSFHTDDVPAGSVFHKVPIHIVRHTKSAAGIPYTEYVVYRVYDHGRKRLRDLEDEEYPDTDKVVIGALIDRGESTLGDLPDANDEELAASALSEKRPNGSASKEAPEEEPDRKRRRSGRFEGKPRTNAVERLEKSFADTKGAGAKDSEQQKLLTEHGAQIGDKGRDKALGLLLKEVQPGEEGAAPSDEAIGARIGRLKELEQAAFEAKGQNRKAYNALLRHLVFNLRSLQTLRQRFFNGELSASVVIGMDPKELKDGYTAEEKRNNEPVHDDPEPIEMVDKTCTVCGSLQVGVKDIISGGKGQFYQLECLSCGNGFTSTEADIVKVTAGPVDPLKHEKDAPSASMKFADVESHMEAQMDVLGGYKEARIPAPEAAAMPEVAAAGHGKSAAEVGSALSAFKESNALKSPAETELGGPQAGGRPKEAIELLMGT